MRYRKFFIGLAFCFLLWQINSINYSFLIPLKTTSIGQLESVSKIVEDHLGHQSVPSKNLIFTGDIMLARNVEVLMKEKESDYPFKGLDLKSIGNSIIFGNFEASIPKLHVPTKMNELVFSVPEDSLQALKKAGFSYLSFANNHSFDYGRAGLENTEKKFFQYDLKPIGSPDKLDRRSVEFIKVGDLTVAVIAIHTLVKNPSDNQISAVFSYAQERSDFQIVYVHWGEEYELLSSENQQNMASLFVKNGADLVVGHHPHVVQEIDVINGVPIFYSLGNYIFDQYFSRDVQVGLVIDVNVGDASAIKLLPISSLGSLSQPRQMTAKDSAIFLEKLAQKSNRVLQAYILNGEIPLNFQFASSSKLAMIVE